MKNIVRTFLKIPSLVLRDVYPETLPYVAIGGAIASLVGSVLYVALTVGETLTFSAGLELVARFSLICLLSGVVIWFVFCLMAAVLMFLVFAIVQVGLVLSGDRTTDLFGPM